MKNYCGIQTLSINKRKEGLCYLDSRYLLLQTQMRKDNNMGNGYEKYTIAEIRDVLQTEYDVIDEGILSQTKRPLVDLLLQLQKEREEEEEKASEDVESFGYQVEDVEEEQEYMISTPALNEKLPQDAPPHFYSSLWSKYVMSLFDTGELHNGHPTCDSCRRLVNQLLGPIVESGVANIIPANNENRGTSTVVFQIKVFVTNENHPLCGKVLHMEDVGDCNRQNTDHPYSKYLSATAATRAEGRILRKLLGLTTIVAEETSDHKDEEEEIYGVNVWPDNTFIKSNQESVIDIMCKRTNMNVQEFINSGENKYGDISKIPYDTAVLMIKELNNIQRQVKEKPSNIGNYQKS